MEPGCEAAGTGTRRKGHAAPSCCAAITWTPRARPSSMAPMPMPVTWTIPTSARCITPAPPYCRRSSRWPRREDAGGRALLEAAICGYEASLRIGLAVQPALFHRGFMATPTCGALGAALAVGKLLHFSPEDLAGALGAAGCLRRRPCPVLPIRDPSSSGSTAQGPLSPASWRHSSPRRASGVPATFSKARPASFAPSPRNPTRLGSRATWGANTG